MELKWEVHLMTILYVLFILGPMISCSELGIRKGRNKAREFNSKSTVRYKGEQLVNETHTNDRKITLM